MGDDEAGRRLVGRGRKDLDGSFDTRLSERHGI